MSMRHENHTGQLHGIRGVHAILNLSVDPQSYQIHLHALEVLEAGQQEPVAGCRKDNLSLWQTCDWNP